MFYMFYENFDHEALTSSCDSAIFSTKRNDLNEIGQQEPCNRNLKNYRKF